MRIEWIHPSWRDLVIDHLASYPEARERFLSRCSLQGLLLALSVAGGRDGQRQLPLLITDADWDALTGRVYLLTPDLDASDLSALLSSIHQAIGQPERRRAALEALALAHAVLQRLARIWDQAKDPVPLPALGAWFGLASGLPPDPPPPAPPDLTHTWAELFPAGTPELADRESVERFADWLTLADLVREQQPDDLGRLSFYDAIETVDGFVTQVERDPDSVHPAAFEAVRAALRRIQALIPQLALRTMYLDRRLGDATPEPAAASHHHEPPSSREHAGWARFDVARVLRDL